ncbi:NAD(P)/FAD-dependent oxidoreductase [Candidatus Dependentiae bacterium]|nr:NAD(P)/FAD-dependent oxidoreductase [Candidatus Dependentiae bacterium]
MDEVNITVIGAGAVGLAVAAVLSEKYDNIIVIEKNEKFGQETSSRNSEVIHSGIYYPTGSLKAKLCVEGAQKLYEFLKKNNVDFLETGKLIAASDKNEIPVIEKLYDTGKKNGVENINIVDSGYIEKIEPFVKGIFAIHLKNTGIFDSHSYMKKLYYKAEESGVTFVFGAEVDYIEKNNFGFIIGSKNDSEYRFKTRFLINCAGLNSDRIAELAGIDVVEKEYKLRYCKGSYFSYSKSSPVKILVYPAPAEHLTGLGVHATVDLGGRLRFGPDTEFIEIINYDVNPDKKNIFFSSASKLISGLEEKNFIPDCAGIRPKINGKGIKDFIIKKEEGEVSGLINLIGIESPGLTASLSIADYVKNMVD